MSAFLHETTTGGYEPSPQSGCGEQVQFSKKGEREVTRSAAHVVCSGPAPFLSHFLPSLKPGRDHAKIAFRSLPYGPAKVERDETPSYTRRKSIYHMEVAP